MKSHTLTQLLRPLLRTCRYCRQPAGLLRRTHLECRRTHEYGRAEMGNLAILAGFNQDFDEPALREALQAVANRSYASEADIETALEEGRRQRSAYDQQGNLVSGQEDEQLRIFDDEPDPEENSADWKSI